MAHDTNPQNPMPNAAGDCRGQRSGSAVVRFFKRLFVACILLALAALTLILLSERNARLYKLEISGSDTIYVFRGRLFPVGFERWHPDDEELAASYAPFHLADSVLAGFDDTKIYSERSELDRVLFDLHEHAAKMLTGREDNDSIEETVRLLERASRLGGITEVQKTRLREMTARSAFFEGRLRLQEASAKLERALFKLRTARESGNSTYTHRADELLDKVKDHALALMAASREMAGESDSSGADSEAAAHRKGAHGASARSVRSDAAPALASENAASESTQDTQLTGGRPAGGESDEPEAKKAAEVPSAQAASEPSPEAEAEPEANSEPDDADKAAGGTDNASLSD